MLFINTVFTLLRVLTTASSERKLRRLSLEIITLQKRFKPLKSTYKIWNVRKKKRKTKLLRGSTPIYCVIIPNIAQCVVCVLWRKYLYWCTVTLLYLLISTIIKCSNLHPNCTQQLSITKLMSNALLLVLHSSNQLPPMPCHAAATWF